MHDDGLNWVIIELEKDFIKSVISNPFAPGGILQMLCSKLQNDFPDWKCFTFKVRW